MCGISGSNAGHTMFRGSVKGTGYSLHSPVPRSLPLPCVTVCHHISTWLYHQERHFKNSALWLENYICVFCLDLGKNSDCIQTSVHELLGSWTIRFTNKFSEHKASRMTHCVSSYEHASRQKRKRIPFQTVTFHFLTTFHLRRQLSSIPVR